MSRFTYLLNLLIQQNKMDEVHSLLDMDMNLPDVNQDIPLIVASKMGNIELVELLLSKGAILDIQDNKKNTALYTATFNNQIGVVKLLLEQGADFNVKNDLNHTALSAACGKGYLEIVKLLLEKGADINEIITKTTTPLSYAIGNNQIEMVKYLLDKGADINIDMNMPPLYLASGSDNIKLVKLILEQDVNVNAQNHDGNTALMIASYFKNIEILKLLLERDADVNILNKDNVGVLDFAIYKDKLDIVKLLLENGANINNQDKNGVTPLMNASMLGHTEIIKLLLEQGADVNIRNKYGETVLLSAKNEQIEKLLLDKGANKELMDIDKEVTYFDVLEAEDVTVNIRDYLQSDKDNIMILYKTTKEGKITTGYFGTHRSTIKALFNDKTNMFHGCHKVTTSLTPKEDEYDKATYLKINKMGLVGTIPEYVDIQDVQTSTHQLYYIVDIYKTYPSFVSVNVFDTNVPDRLIGAAHCQGGDKAGVSILKKVYPNEHPGVRGGRVERGNKKKRTYKKKIKRRQTKRIKNA